MNTITSDWEDVLGRRGEVVLLYAVVTTMRDEDGTHCTDKSYHLTKKGARFGAEEWGDSKVKPRLAVQLSEPVKGCRYVLLTENGPVRIGLADEAAIRRNIRRRGSGKLTAAEREVLQVVD